MAPRKRNDFLDIASSDDEAADNGYDSEAAEKSKGRSAKRRRLTTDADSITGSDDEVESENGDYGDGNHRLSEPLNRVESIELQEEAVEKWDEEDVEQEVQQQPRRLLEPSPNQNLSCKLSKKNKTGVIYLSSLPPYLKPMALKSLLVQRGFGPITRVFLAPAVHSTNRSRRSNRRKIYTDGWVEFASKKTAKICTSTLNATVVGGKKGGWYHDDVWNMKYLTGFKWDDLMEQVQRERSEREARRRIEDARARKEEKIFLAGVEQSKVTEGIRKKREGKKKDDRDSLGNDAGGPSNLPVHRIFKQSEVKSEGSKVAGTLGDDTKRILGKIF